MGRTNSKEKDKEKDLQVKLKVKSIRPGDPRVPCFAILGRTSELKVINLDGGSSSSVKISAHPSLGIVTIDREVYAVTQKEILKLHSDGTTLLSPLPVLDLSSKIVLFQKKIYIIQPYRKRMLCFDPVDNSLNDMPGCELGFGFCASATDDFICAMGGQGTETQSIKYNPPTRTWEEIAPMMKERVWAAAATLDGKIYVMGGDGVRCAAVEYYNPDNNSWTEISNMNTGHSYFSACVVDDRLYAVGCQRGEKKNGLYQFSIEVYDNNKWKKEWTVATKFQAKDLAAYSCFWPHRHQPGTTQSKDLPDRLQSVKLLQTKEDEYAGRKVSLREGDLDEGKEISVFVEEKEPETKEAISSSTFKLDENYFPRTQLLEKEISKPSTSGDNSESEKFSLKTEGRTEKESTGAVAGGIPDIELQHLDFQYIPLSTDKAVGPEGDNLSVDECSLTIRPKSLFDTRNLSISMLMHFQNLDLPADMIPVSPYLDVKFCGKLDVPAKARVPTWFRPSEDSEHGIKIYKRYRDEENKLTWRELQNEVTVHDGMIEFEIDHFCGFIAMIKDVLYWLRGEIRLSHGLLHCGENFLSVICYQSPKSLFQQMIAYLKENDHKEIYRNSILVKSTQKFPIRMETFDPHTHEFHPQERLVTPSNITCDGIQLPFLLRHLKEPKDEVEIKYIVDEFEAAFKVRLFDPKAKSAVGINVSGDGATFNIGEVRVHAGDEGDVSTVINAPVGQLATGSANITNQGSGNNFVAGSQENTDSSVTAGKAIYGQSTSSSVGENITVHRAGK